MVSWDRCYDFLNIFAEKFSEKIGVFDSKQRQILNNCDRNIGILEKRQIFCQKLGKIAENCDDNIGPLVVVVCLYSYFFFWAYLW
jgi:hypothetical protein